MSVLGVLLLLLWTAVDQTFAFSARQIHHGSHKNNVLSSTTQRAFSAAIKVEDKSAQATLAATKSSQTSTTTTRRSLGKRLLSATTALSGLLAISNTSPSFASTIDPENALRNVRRAQRQLETKLKSLLDAQQYQELREALRLDPLGSVRKNCFALVGPVDNPNTQKLSAYQTFIAALERLDATAGLILRGRNVPDTEMQDYYQTTVQSLQRFIDLVATATTNASETSDVVTNAAAK
jgi:hypothetical protein